MENETTPLIWTGGNMRWEGSKDLPSKTFMCGHCGERLASNKGFSSDLVSTSGGNHPPRTSMSAAIYLCHFCQAPTYFRGDYQQVPGPPFGGTVEHIPYKDVTALYDEARNCMKVTAYTAAVMCCRKLLMNLAVAEGASKNKGFKEYVTYLSEQGHIPPRTEAWVDHIRNKGNEANHEIEIMERAEAERLIKFSEMLLRIMYEYPAEVDRPTA